jgi:hypothetical protein
MSSKWRWVSGLVLHVLIAGLLLMAGSSKLMGSPPPEMTDMLSKAGPGFVDNLRVIAIGEIVTAVLLILPWTASLGVLMASGFWGGTICFHLGQNQLFAVQSAFLVATWVGAWLRMPEMFRSFSWSPMASPAP